MKKNLLKRSFLPVLVALAATACSEEINIGAAQAPDTNPGEVYISHNLNGTVDIRNSGSVAITANVNTPRNTDTNLSLVYDSSALDDYNAANGTRYEALPQSLVSLSSSSVTLPAGRTSSDAVTMNLKSDESLTPGATYAVPLRVSSNDSRAVGSVGSAQVVLVRDLTKIPDCHKTVKDASGNDVDAIKIFAVPDGQTPLNALRFTLKNSGKHMVDAVVLFSGNINYDNDNQKVYFFANDFVSYCMNNPEEMIQPFHDRGIKVIVGVMCNHDRACIAGLNEESAKMFAQEMKEVCDAYGFDGIFWDDEYCNHNPNLPGFTTRSSTTWSRLAYECWKLQPERWNVAYGYSNTASAIAIDGVQPGTYIDYVLPDYGYGMRDYSTAFPGMQRSQMGAYSIECGMSYYFRSLSYFQSMRTNGYGAIMVFGLNPFNQYASQQENAFRNMAQAFYDDECVIDPTTYTNKW